MYVLGYNGKVKGKKGCLLTQELAQHKLQVIYGTKCSNVNENPNRKAMRKIEDGFALNSHLIVTFKQQQHISQM